MARARGANSREEFVAIAQDELKLLAARRGSVERRGEPDANSASWGGFQLPLAVFVAIAVFPAVGLYLLYALYAAQAALQQGGTAVDRHFWFPRLGSPGDPLASPWPRSLSETLPRAFGCCSTRRPCPWPIPRRCWAWIHSGPSITAA